MTEAELERVANRLTIAAAGISLFYTGYKAYGIKGALATTLIPTAILWYLIDTAEKPSEKNDG
jgi:hypothetical protein